MIVLDASAALEALLRAGSAAAVERRLFEGGQIVCTPDLADVEIAQVLRRYVGSGEIAAERGRTALADWMDFPVTRYPHDALLPRMWELRRNLSACDAVYVALAEALVAPLLTCDRRLANAPGHRARVELA